ncbi:hypothetical protein FQN49_002289 [Arthroderma sp. PD_2]|nr:hypothetical protein FQN49_002289 [Arthroderma sp. PD_2]
MVVDLTMDGSDSECDSTNPEISTLELLNAFTGKRSTSPVLNRSQHIHTNCGSSSSSRPQSRPRSKCSNVSVVIPVPRPSSSQSSHAKQSRKRSRSTDDDTDIVLSQKLAATKLPDHNGLSPFYAIEVDSSKHLYRKLKKCDRSTIGIPRKHRRFIPQIRRESTSDRLEFLYKKKLSKIEGPPISFTSRYKARNIDFNFDFIKTYRLQDRIESIESGFLFGCSCVKCSENCDCLIEDNEPGKRIIPYHSSQNGRLVLRDDFIKRKGAIIRECSPICNCTLSKCWNHVVYRGRQVKLEIFETIDRGFGIRSLNFIQKGQFIDTYVGELIKTSISDQREEAFDTDKHASYLFSLDYYYGSDEYDESKACVIDGRKYGSITRFINHSCNPNCRIFSVTQDDDKHIYQLAFFAIRDIPAGTELTFDYAGTTPDSEAVKADPNAIKCLCGEPNCRGQLWLNRRQVTHGDIDSSSDE